MCFWEFHPAEPDAPRDTSATAIAAAALLKLAPLAGEHYRAAAAETLDALAGHLGRHGGLVDGCYNAHKALAPRHELIWGDYFALEAALALPGSSTRPCCSPQLQLGQVGDDGPVDWGPPARRSADQARR